MGNRFLNPDVAFDGQASAAYIAAVKRFRFAAIRGVQHDGLYLPTKLIAVGGETANKV